jgi:hypothetical protein
MHTNSKKKSQRPKGETNIKKGVKTKRKIMTEKESSK